MGNTISRLFLVFLFLNVVVLCNAQINSMYHDIYIYEVNFTRLCETTLTLTANGSLPGPTIYANKGETIYVTVHNRGSHGITIHWHGVLQPRNPWSDGSLNITQCPIQPGSSFRYELIFSKEEGTIWYHAYGEYSMATVHGAIVVRPPDNKYPYTFDEEQEIVLGTWYIEEVSKVYKAAKANNNYFPPANATTINGQPGYPSNCSFASSFNMTVEYNKTYLLRVVNAVLSEDQFFGIAGHNLTLVGHDGAYTKPLTSEYIRISPGQTMDVLFTANQTPGCYFMAAAPYFFTGGYVPTFTNKTTSATLRYSGSCGFITDPTSIPYPKLPAIDDTAAALNFTNAIRSLNSAEHPAIVPRNINKNVTISAGRDLIGTTPSAFLNNISFVFPNISILEAYTRDLSGYFDEDFPSQVEDGPVEPQHGTKALLFNYSDEVQMVFSGEVHPIHIHGFTFYVVASGPGNFKQFEDTITTCNETTPPSAPCYNFVDPPQLNTVSIPDDGWVAIRFVANNPGVWFAHCNYARHISLGLNTVFIVRNGTSDAESMLPTPINMPPCRCNQETPCLSSAPIKEHGYLGPFASV